MVDGIKKWAKVGGFMSGGHGLWRSRQPYNSLLCLTLAAIFDLVSNTRVVPEWLRMAAMIIPLSDLHHVHSALRPFTPAP